MGCRWTPWDAAGDRRTPLVQCRSPKNAKRILDDLDWTATWDTVGFHWSSMDLQKPRKEFWMIYTGLHCWTPWDTVGHRWTSWDTVGHRGTSWDIVGHRGTPWDTVGHRGTSLDIVGHRWTPLDTVGRRGTPWNTVGHRGTPLVQCGSPNATKRILDDLHWTATWDTIGSVWISKCREKYFG